MQTYQVSLIGQQALLMHKDDIEWADEMEDWRVDKDNKKNSKAGDDRTPAHRWMGRCIAMKRATSFFRLTMSCVRSWRARLLFLSRRAKQQDIQGAIAKRNTAARYWLATADQGQGDQCQAAEGLAEGKELQRPQGGG